MLIALGIVFGIVLLLYFLVEDISTSRKIRQVERGCERISQEIEREIKKRKCNHEYRFGGISNWRGTAYVEEASFFCDKCYDSYTIPVTHMPERQLQALVALGYIRYRSLLPEKKTIKRRTK